MERKRRSRLRTLCGGDVLRGRLGKEVALVSYTNGRHGMPTSTIEEVKDYHQRILDWYNDHLKDGLKKKKAEEAKAESGQH